MAFSHWLCAALCLTLTVAPAAWAQEAPEDVEVIEGEIPEEMPEEAPQVSPGELKKQLQNFKPGGGDMAGVAELTRIARAIKANGGKMTVDDAKSLRATLKQVRAKGSATSNPLYADLFDQLDAALARVEKQIADPDGWAESEMPTE